ncbi:MAG: class I SAM-dependent methyltransferase [Chitinophagaceae bacterium]
MKASDLASISDFHHKLIAEYGVEGIDAVGWLSNASQNARYSVLSKLGDFTGKSVLDAGCGHADLFPFLSKIYPDMQYTGIEQMPELMNIAVKRYGHYANTKFLKCDFSETALPASDYVIACGSLSYCSSEDGYIYSIIEKLFAHCRIGFGFNLLSALKYPDPAIVFYNPNTILTFCNTLTNKVTLQLGYWENDFTVFMYR